MEKILNLQRGWKSRLWFGEKAFALCFVIFTAFTGLVSVNAGPGALYESHTFRTILNVMLTAAAYVIAIDLVYNMMFNFSQRFLSVNRHRRSNRYHSIYRWIDYFICIFLRKNSGRFNVF